MRINQGIAVLALVIAGAVGFVFGQITPRVIGVTKPGGLWIQPQHNQVITGPLEFRARAYPTNRWDPLISYVNFTAEVGGTWIVACRADTPLQGDVYGCTWDPRIVARPGEQFRISFDVYDQKGGTNKAPHGLRMLTYRP